MVRIVADTNIYISALQFRGKPLDLLNLASIHRKIRLILSDHIVEEISRTLQTRFRWPEAKNLVALETIRSCADHVFPVMKLDVVTWDPDDNKILECAVAGKADYIVTGDNHLLRLRHFDSIHIVTVADLLRNYLGYIH